MSVGLAPVAPMVGPVVSGVVVVVTTTVVEVVGAAVAGGDVAGTVGPVQSANVTGSGSEWSYPVNVTITARDSLGNTTVVSRPALVTVHNCTVIL